MNTFFKDIEPGDCFVLNEEKYMKIYISDKSLNCGAVNLKTGKICAIIGSETVKKVDAFIGIIEKGRKMSNESNNKKTWFKTRI